MTKTIILQNYDILQPIIITSLCYIFINREHFIFLPAWLVYCAYLCLSVYISILYYIMQIHNKPMSASALTTKITICEINMASCQSVINIYTNMQYICTYMYRQSLLDSHLHKNVLQIIGQQRFCIYFFNASKLKCCIFQYKSM